MCIYFCEAHIVEDVYNTTLFLTENYTTQKKGKIGNFSTFK